MNKEDIKAAVGEALDEKLGDFFIERERHYADHQFVSGIRAGADQVKKASLWALGLAIAGGVAFAIKSWITHLARGG